MESPWTRVYETDSIKWPLRVPLHKTKVPSHGHVCSRATGLMFHLSMFPFTCQVLPIYFARLPRSIARLLQRGHDRPELRDLHRRSRHCKSKLRKKPVFFNASPCHCLGCVMLQIEGLHVFYCSLMFSALGKQKAPGRWLHRFWRVWFRRVSSVQHNWSLYKAQSLLCPVPFALTLFMLFSSTVFSRSQCHQLENWRERFLALRISYGSWVVMWQDNDHWKKAKVFKYWTAV